jgi:hypothetical protein
MAAAEIKMHQGVPTLFIDGAPYPPFMYFFTVPVKKYIKDFAEAGIHLYSWGWSDIANHSMDMEWIGPGKYDYSRLDREVETILSADPEALLIPRVAVSAPSWWLKEHPDEAIVFDDGSREHPVSGANYGGEHVSMASEHWLEEATGSLNRFVKHIRDQFYSDHIIGYQLTGGVNEWFYVSFIEKRFADFSKAALSAFRRWLRKKYDGDVSALRRAWKAKEVDFENVSVPDKAKRLESDLNLLRDPSVSRHVIDYYEFISEINADALIHLCKVGKAAAKGCIFGAFFGYLTALSHNIPYPQQIGHQALRRVLESPYVDFLCAPYQYFYRGPGGTTAPQAPVDTIKLHGKLWFDECDHATFLTNRSKTKVSVSEESLGVIKAMEDWESKREMPNLKETLGIMKRDFSYRLIKRIGLWFIDLIPGQGWYHHPEITKCIARMKEIMEKSVHLDDYYKGEVAVIIDEETPYYVRSGYELFYSLVYLQENLGLSRVGAPYDVYIHNDLVDPRMPDYKLYIFLSTLYLTREEREAIKSKVRRNGSTVVWMYGPGFISEKGFSIENVRDLVGMKIFYEESRYNHPSGNGGPLLLHITDFNHPITREISPDTFFGSNSTVGPIFYCKDPTARALGSLLTDHQDGICQPGFAVKEFDDWTSIFIGVPNVPPSLLRNIARYAGCHIYSDDSIVYASKYFLAVHTNRGGAKEIRLKRKSDVYDAFSGELVAKNTKVFKDKIPQYDTKLYFLGDISKIS